MRLQKLIKVLDVHKNYTLLNITMIKSSFVQQGWWWTRFSLFKGKLSSFFHNVDLMYCSPWMGASSMIWLLEW